MSSGRAFHVDGAECEHARSPNLLRSCGRELSIVEPDLERKITLAAYLINFITTANC